MALIFPLSLPEFWDALGVRSVTWVAQENVQLSGMGSGQILEADLAPALRIADVSLNPLNANKASWVEARLEAIRTYKGSFYAYDPRKCCPRLDPYGTILGSAAVKINAVTGTTLSLKGLTNGYKLSAGDCLSYDYGTNPVRRAYHRILEDVTADSSGVTSAFMVSPMVPGGAAVDAPVVLIKPTFKAIIRPGSIEVSTPQFSSRTEITFSILQKI